MYEQPRILDCGDAAISVEFANEISQEISDRVLALDVDIRRQRLENVIETVPTYRSLLVRFDPLETDVDRLCCRLREMARNTLSQKRTNRRWRIPVLYGGEYGIDLDELSWRQAMSREEFVARHTAVTYRVAMIGFMPGFAYLSGLDPRLEAPRRTTPRQNAPPGTVSIGGAQTAVQSVPGPSGWHWIGRTPLEVFRSDREPMCLLEAGDVVEFASIREDEWQSEAERLQHEFEFAA